MSAVKSRPAGVIQPGVVYALSEFRAVTGWGRHAWRTAVANGLPIIRTAGRTYISGDDAIAYLKAQAAPARRHVTREEAAACEGIA